MDENSKLAYVVMYKKDFYTTPKIIGVSMDEKTAELFAWSEAKRRFRYSGMPRTDYQYFDQAIRTEQVPLL